MPNEKIRVLRLLEYIYDTPDRMIDDMARWQVQGTKRYGNMTIHSTTLSPEILTEENVHTPNDLVTLPNDSARTAVDRMGSSEYIKFLPEDE